MDMDDAVRLNPPASASRSISAASMRRVRYNMIKLVDAGLRAGIPVLAMTGVGKAIVRDAKYFRLACRISAEMGAQYVKTYYVEKDFGPSPRLPGADGDGRRQEAS